MTTTTTIETASPTEVLYCDPAVLAENPENIRDDIGDVSDIARTIASVGILEPLVVTTRDDGSLRLLAGYRRLAAALQAGLEQVPYIVRPDLSAPVDSVIAMLIENTQRKDLTPAERSKAYEQLRGFGLTAAAIAKKTGAKQGEVKTALTVAASPVALGIAERHAAFTFDQLAVFAEFERDEETLKTLASVAQRQPSQFDHVVSQAREERERQAEFALAAETLETAGVPVIEEPQYGTRTAARKLRDLVDAKGKDITEDKHVKCSGHVASISPYRGARVTFWCSDPTLNGHKDRYGRSASSQSTTERGEDGKLTEDARAARRLVIDNNRAMDAAIPVRLTFIRTLLARKAVPKGALRYAAEDLSAHPRDLSDATDDLLAALVGIDRKTSGTTWTRSFGPQLVADATDARLPVVLLAHVAASVEATWTKEAWRQTSDRRAAWLTFLSSEGYAISEVEQLVIDSAEAHRAKRASVMVTTQPVTDDDGLEDADGGDEEA